MLEILRWLAQSWLGGLIAGLLVGWMVGSAFRRQRLRQVQHSGDNSVSVQVGQQPIGGLGYSRFAHRKPGDR